jgi:hypothetical protein
MAQAKRIMTGEFLRSKLPQLRDEFPQAHGVIDELLDDHALSDRFADLLDAYYAEHGDLDQAGLIRAAGAA